MTLYDQIQAAMAYVRRCTDFRPTTGIILGTGLGSLTQDIRPVAAIPYADIPHFVVSTVESHAGHLLLGYLNEVPVAVLSGRFHYYEGWTMQQVTFPVRVLKALGVERLVITNVSGGVNPHLQGGDLLVVRDHINLLPDNPLRGPNDERLGPRFPDMLHTYDAAWRTRVLDIARREGIRAQEGVYCALQGPSLETPAEYSMMRLLGADCVGMSSVPEVIVARHSGLSVLMLSMITNVSFPPSALRVTTIESVIATAQAAEPQFRKLVTLALGNA
jgi:purine-nucleoside phosphorylase